VDVAEAALVLQLLDALARQARAIDCPWFPVLAVMMPRRSSADRLRTRLTPPRTLKAQVGLWFSCLTNTSRPVSAASSGWRRSGVRVMTGRMRSRAA
jgi:hypothetical protein